MAISLLHNASDSHQTLAAHFMRHWMSQRNLLVEAERMSREEQSRFFRFPFSRREDRNGSIMGTVELFKHLPITDREDLAVILINYMYTLELGLSEPEFPEGFPQDELICYEMTAS
jgi:hypothetical protein